MENDVTQTLHNPLAVVGMACRLPGGINSPHDFWEILTSGRETIGNLPSDRWDLNSWLHTDPSKPGKSYATRGGFLEGIDQFDAAFFGISPREASHMDPQQRLLLEMTWDALEDAGQSAKALAGSDTAVFVGISAIDYQHLQFLDPESANAYSNPGSSNSIAANRISYVFDFHGPSIALDTACSSSLVALHLACGTLWNGQSPLAIVGGVNVLLSPFPWVGFSKASMLSPTGRCLAFDANANGYVRSEGGGVLVLKPLDAAIRDRDPIRALIMASGTNCDGRTRGMLLPSAAAQETLLHKVYSSAQIQGRDVCYVEAHGTGTAVGDPIECSALSGALSQDRKDQLLIGSVKTNIGHLEPAAGIAGAIKVILSMQHRQLPPSLHFNAPNPAIDLEAKKLRVVTQLTSLKDHPAPLRMGVNSFGFGGANAHVVFQEYDGHSTEISGPPQDPPLPMPLYISAHGEEPLKSLAEKYCQRLSSPMEDSLYNLCYTAALRRAHHSHRLAVFGRTKEEMAGHLSNYVEQRESPFVVGDRILQHSAGPVFVFSGNGSQWEGMGSELMGGWPLFREAIQRIDAYFEPMAGWSIFRLLSDRSPAGVMSRTEYAQPALFAVQVALAELLNHYGISPVAVLGHSVGEVAAAYVAGIFTLEQSVRVIFERSRAQAQTAGLGKMAACGLSAEQAKDAIARYNHRFELAAINACNSVTLSGEPEMLTALGAELAPAGTFFRLLDLDYAFHSRAMDEIRQELIDSLAGLAPGFAKVPLISTTLGSAVQGPELGAEYWWKNVRQPVFFGPAVELLIENGNTVFIEIGPHPVLDFYLRQSFDTKSVSGRSIPTLRKEQAEKAAFLNAVGRCYTSGCEMNLGALFPAAGHCVPLPAYPWQRERHWNGSAIGRPRIAPDIYQHPLLGYRVLSADPLWENLLDPSHHRYLADHQVLGAIVLPAAAMVEMTLKAAEFFRGTSLCHIEDLNIRRPLVLNETEPVPIQFTICAEDGTFHLRGCQRGITPSWTLHATGRISPPTEGDRPPDVNLAELISSFRGHLDAESFYEECHNKGLQYGPAFRRVKEIWLSPGQALAQLNNEIRPDEEPFIFPPTLLDACFQAMVAASFSKDGSHQDSLYLPAQLGRFRIFSAAAEAAYCHVILELRSARSLVFHVDIYDAQGHVVASIDRLRARRMGLSSASATMPMLELAAEKQPKKNVPSTSTSARTFALLKQKMTAGEENWLAELGTRLSAAGHSVVTLEMNPTCPPDGPASDVQGNLDTENFKRAFVRHATSALPITDVVHGWGIADGPYDSSKIRESVEHQCLIALSLVQGMLDANLPSLPRLWFFTREAMTTPEGKAEIRPDQAALWGWARVLPHEIPHLDCRLIDFHGSLQSSSSMDLLISELIEPDEEDEIILSDTGRWVHRLRRTSLAERRLAEQEPARDDPYRVVLSRPGSPDNLVLDRCSRVDPEPDQVEIRVSAVGLNFHDMMWIMGLLPDEAVETGFAGPTLGMECAGRVLRVGSGVIDFQPGDEVIAFAPQCLSAFLLANQVNVFPKPPGLSLEAAATLPIVFSTVIYALEKLGRLQRGERVLIHSASGGVGLAAVQYAKHVGAEIYATVGTEEKREYLRSLGVQNIFNSHTSDFADQILAATNGEGVDVVLNSLAGEMVALSFSVLRPFGRFLELGKRDFFEFSRMGMAPFRNNLSYFGIDLDQALAMRPEFGREVMSRLIEGIRQEEFQPLPFQLFPISQIREAFRCMQQGRHIGKIVVSFEDAAVRLPRKRKGAFHAREDGTYLIAGGLRGFGLETASWLADHGARHLVLASRTGVIDPEAAEIVDRIKETGAHVLTAKVDITKEDELSALMSQISADMPPLLGVIMAAMVLDDVLAQHMTPIQFWRAAEPKIFGAWNLHRQTLETPLDFFVMFSSATTILGNPGQANYAAGNAFLEALAHYRRTKGLPGTAISWGAISERRLSGTEPNGARNAENAHCFAPHDRKTGIAESGRDSHAGLGKPHSGRFGLERTWPLAHFPGALSPVFSLVGTVEK